MSVPALDQKSGTMRKNKNQTTLRINKVLIINSRRIDGPGSACPSVAVSTNWRFGSLGIQFQRSIKSLCYKPATRKLAIFARPHACKRWLCKKSIMIEEE
jgi:hypothetical protein